MEPLFRRVVVVVVMYLSKITSNKSSVHFFPHVNISLFFSVTRHQQTFQLINVGSKRKMTMKKKMSVDPQEFYRRRCRRCGGENLYSSLMLIG